MTREERIQAVIDFGFTERQARFLGLVVRHAGVCVPRQYASLAGVPHGGRRCNAFFAKLVRRGYASEIRCVHNRARLYHLHSKRLYYAIGEPNSRYRRSVPARVTLERLMLLDAVLASPDLAWLTTASEKADLLAALPAAAPADSCSPAPGGARPGSAAELPGTFPIGLEGSGRVVVLYLATVPWTVDFRTFLQGHANLLRLVPGWTLRLVFPRPVDRAYDAYQTVIREELETPLQPATIRELKWYFEHRRAAVDQAPHSLTRALLDRGLQVFSGPRFSLLYRRWLKHGDVVLDSLSSPLIAEALPAGTGDVQNVVLPHSYRHLAPLVDDAPSSPRRVEKALRRGNKEGNRPPHALNARPQPPHAESELTVKEQCERDWERLNEWYKAQKTLRLAP